MLYPLCRNREGRLGRESVFNSISMPFIFIWLERGLMFFATLTCNLLYMLYRHSFIACRLRLKLLLIFVFFTYFLLSYATTPLYTCTYTPSQLTHNLLSKPPHCRQLAASELSLLGGMKIECIVVVDDVILCCVYRRMGKNTNNLFSLLRSLLNCFTIKISTR